MENTNCDYDQLFKAYQPLIKKMMKQLGYQSVNDELYQVGRIALWEAQNNFKENKGYFSSYAKKFIRGRMLFHLKSEAKFYDQHNPYVDDQFLEQFAADPLEEKPYLLIQNILPLLSKRERQWFTEAIIHEKGLKQVATELNVSVNSVKTWRERAIKKIRKHQGKTTLVKYIK